MRDGEDLSATRRIARSGDQDSELTTEGRPWPEGGEGLYQLKERLKDNRSINLDLLGRLEPRSCSVLRKGEVSAVVKLKKELEKRRLTPAQ